MARSAGELFKDTGFLLKFIELLLIVSSAVVWLLFFNGFIGADVYLDLATVLALAALYYFFPVGCMLIIYVMESFPDKMYELILAAGGAATTGFAGIFYLLAYYETKGTKAKANYRDQFGTRMDATESIASSSPGEEEFIIISLLMFLLMVAYICDAVINGAGKNK